jgi:SET domain-containing protein
MRTIRPGLAGAVSPKKASHIRMGLIIRSSAIHAAGCYTTTPIRKDGRVAEYTGPRLTKKEADTLYDDSPLTYLFGLGDGSSVIDGHCMAMFINHSCDPNCETNERDGSVWIKAIRNIPAGAEITYDYCLYDGGEDDAICNCGAKACKGTMYSPAEVRKRRAKAREGTRGKKAGRR